MKIHRLLYVCTCIASMMAQESASRVAFSESRDVVPAVSSSGSITLPAVHLQLDITYSGGKKERRDLSVVYDPQNGYYLWHLASFPAPAQAGRFTDAVKSNKEVIYADADGIVDFVFRSDLWVKVYKSRAESLDAAERSAVSEVEKGVASIERYQPRTGPMVPSWPWDYKPVDLGKTIAADFSCMPMRADCKDDLNTIASIGRSGSKWRLVLRNRWDQEITLDSDFTLVGAQRLQTPK